MFKNIHPTVQSIGTAIVVVIALGSAFHNVIIAPISTDLEEARDASKERMDKLEAQWQTEIREIKNEQKELNKSVGAIEIHQAKIGVNIENLATSIDRLAVQLERQLTYPAPQGRGD